MDKQQFEDHLSELLSRLKKVAAVFAIAAIAGWFLSEPLISVLQETLEVDLHAVQVYEILYARINLALLIALSLTLPFLAYELIKFAKPGLTEEEYKFLKLFTPLGFILFIVGSVFAYQFVVSTAVNFFWTQTQLADITAVWSLNNTIGFVTRISALTGILFQIPIAIYILNRLGLINRKTLEKNRPWFIVAVLFLSAMATPPDLITQILITLPVIALYEISLRLI